MQDALARAGAWFPPAPTFTGAFAGGIVATNAAGAATFRHGAVRPWVQALTVVLADGSDVVAALKRGERRASRRSAVVPVPTYRMPDVAKVSAGYYAAPDMDADRSLHRLGRHAGRHHHGDVSHAVADPHHRAGFRPLRVRRRRRWRSLADLRREPSVAAIEHMDAAASRSCRRTAPTRATTSRSAGHSARAPRADRAAAGDDGSDAFDQIETSLSASAPDTPLARVCRLLQRTASSTTPKWRCRATRAGPSS